MRHACRQDFALHVCPLLALRIARSGCLHCPQGKEAPANASATLSPVHVSPPICSQCCHLRCLAACTTSQTCQHSTFHIFLDACVAPKLICQLSIVLLHRVAPSPVCCDSCGGVKLMRWPAGGPQTSVHWLLLLLHPSSHWFLSACRAHTSTPRLPAHCLGAHTHKKQA